jgi:hypothetical protein
VLLPAGNFDSANEYMGLAHKAGIKNGPSNIQTLIDFENLPIDPRPTESCIDRSNAADAGVMKRGAFMGVSFVTV